MVVDLASDRGIITSSPVRYTRGPDTMLACTWDVTAGGPSAVAMENLPPLRLRLVVNEFGELKSRLAKAE